VNKFIAALAITAAVALGGCIKMSTTPPTDLPDYVKIMPGAQQKATMDMGLMKAELYETTSSAADVIAFYRAQAQTDGLTEQPTTASSNAAPGEQQATFADASATRLIAVSVKPEGTLQLVTLAYRPAPKAS
jgi:hypothetical protein